MGLFGKLKDLFSGPGGDQPDADTGIYLYVRLNRSGEVVRLRLNPEHELVPDYEAGGYFSRKSVVGPLTFARAEATFRFDADRRLVGHDISGGELVDQSAWDAYRLPAAAPDDAPGGPAGA